jgi:hypothetical protein
MENKIFMRNPSTGLLETKEFSDQLSLLRIADPVATGIVQGFTNTNLAGDKLFPSLRMAKESGRFPAFGKEAFVIPSNLKRGIGEKVQRLQMQSGYIQMALSEYAEGVGIENRERNEWAGSPDMLVNGKLLTVAGRIALFREKLQSVLATTSGNYASGNSASGATLKWATDGDPIVDLRAGRNVILKKIGRYPNKAWFTPSAWELFINNAQVLKRIVYSGQVTPAQITTQYAASLLQVDEVIITTAVYGTSSLAGADGGVKKSALTMGFLWEAVNSACAGLAYVGSAGGIEPSFGYTYERMNSPVIESYYDNATKSQIWDYEHFFDPAITLNEAGYLLYALA